ncbi:MAG: zinc metallopeptidase, partial [Planctomycetales bacterium]
MMYFDPMYLLIVFVPTMLLTLGAQAWLKSAYKRANGIGTSMSGAAAARAILDSAGLQHVPIERSSGW